MGETVSDVKCSRSNQAGAPLPAIGSRAWAVVMMVEPRSCRPHRGDRASAAALLAGRLRAFRL